MPNDSITAKPWLMICHIAFVEIFEWARRRLSPEPARDQAPDIAALLNRHLSHARQGLSVLLKRSGVTHHEDLGMSRNRAIGKHLDAASLVRFHAQPLCCGGGLDPGGPENVPRRDPFSFDDDAFGVHLIHSSTRPHFNP